MITIGALLLALALGVEPGAPADAIADCNQEEDRKRQIAGCSEYLAKGQGSVENRSVAYINRGIANASIGQRERAICDFNEAIKLTPQEPLGHYNRGNVYFDTGRYDRAIRDFTEAVRLSPDTAVIHYNRGLAYERAGNRARALADFRKALAIDPQFEAARERVSRSGRRR